MLSYHILQEYIYYTFLIVLHYTYTYYILNLLNMYSPA